MRPLTGGPRTPAPRFRQVLGPRVTLGGHNNNPGQPERGVREREEGEGRVERDAFLSLACASEGDTRDGRGSSGSDLTPTRERKRLLAV
ncbi:unnamed protein product [Lampetra fluviatilis]